MSITDLSSASEGPWPSSVVRRRFSWALWAQPRSIVAYILLVEATVVASTLVIARDTTVQWHDLVVLAGLTALGIAQAEIGRQTERMRRQLTDTAHINLTSVWTFAGVLLLPPILVAALVVLLYLQLSVRSWYRLREITLYRSIMNTCFVILTCYLARAVLNLFGVSGIKQATDRGTDGILALSASLAVYFLIGAVLVVPTIWARTHSVHEVIGSWPDNFLEVATLCLAVIVALVMVTLPAVSIAILPPLMILHRGLLNRELETTAILDHKTGVLNAASWHYRASRELAKAANRADATLSVLMIDLDHFKRINDQHGHLNGDEVLRAVANCITGEVRDNDAVGRFGGEEFVVLLSRARESEAHTVAERIRHGVTVLDTYAEHPDGPRLINDLSVSIGIATYPHGGGTVTELMHAADAALYRAKSDGRNRIATASADAA